MKTYIIAILVLVILAVILIVMIFWQMPANRLVPPLPSEELSAVPPVEPNAERLSIFASEKLGFEISYPEYLSVSQEIAFYDLAGAYEKSEAAGRIVSVGIVRLSGSSSQPDAEWNDISIYAVHPQDMGATAEESAAFIQKFENDFPQFKEPGEKISSAESITIGGLDFKKNISEAAAGKRITYIYNSSPDSLYIISAKAAGAEVGGLLSEIVPTFKVKQ